jgi:hypothetical protein
MLVQSFDDDDEGTKVSQRLLDSEDEIDLGVDDGFDGASTSNTDK